MAFKHEKTHLSKGPVDAAYRNPLTNEVKSKLNELWAKTNYK